MAIRVKGMGKTTNKFLDPGNKTEETLTQMEHHNDDDQSLVAVVAPNRLGKRISPSSFPSFSGQTDGHDRKTMGSCQFRALTSSGKGRWRFVRSHQDCSMEQGTMPTRR
jgi:hypothetical protein